MSNSALSLDQTVDRKAEKTTILLIEELFAWAGGRILEVRLWNGQILNVESFLEKRAARYDQKQPNRCLEGRAGPDRARMAESRADARQDPGICA